MEQGKTTTARRREPAPIETVTKSAASPAKQPFRQYRRWETGKEILARVADKPFRVCDQGIWSDGEAGQVECHYLDVGGGMSPNGWAMTPDGFERLYEVVK